MILRLLDDLAAELDDSPEAHTVVIAGGAMLALLGLRNSTVDVDSVVPLPQEVRLAAKQVALTHGLGDGWINDSAVPFLPHNADLSNGQEFVTRGRLHVRAVPVRALFAMKVLAGRAGDWQDVVSLWPLCGFASVDEALAAYAAAYPDAPEDPFLGDWIDRIRRASATE